MKMARTSTDPRERSWAMVQLDEIRAASVNKSAPMKTAVALPEGKKATRDLVTHLERQAVYAADPRIRLRAQDDLRQLGRS
ncbi:MAG: hypothetical protein ACHQ0J_05060 [Candidatus Dormibacterales bacterium]